MQWAVLGITLFSSLAVWVLSILFDSYLFVETFGDWFIGGGLLEGSIGCGLFHDSNTELWDHEFQWRGWNIGKIWGEVDIEEDAVVIFPSWWLTAGVVLFGTFLFFRWFKIVAK